MPKYQFKNLDHKLLDFFKNHSLKSCKINLAFSGGVDSRVLLHSLVKLSRPQNLEITVHHVHHGESVHHLQQSEYRNQALEQARFITRDYGGLNFLFKKSEVFLKSEEECREFRQSYFENFENVFFAHHKDDFIETILLKLIRGVGPQGLKGIFKGHKGQFFYPFLDLFLKSDLVEYAKDESISFINDPSDKNAENLRSWLRQNWLETLNAKQGLGGLYSSLENMYQLAQNENLLKFKFTEDLAGLKWQDWLKLDQFQKRSNVAAVLQYFKKTNYTKGQVDEILKRLENHQNEMEFSMAGLFWAVKKNTLSARPVTE